MTSVGRLALIGNALPRRCGIATFTTDLQRAVATARADLHSCVVAMTDPGQVYEYPPVVGRQIVEDSLCDYGRAADFLNAGRFDAVSLQHEFGIFGGEAGEYVLHLLSRLTMPIVTTLHTVLGNPSPKQRAVLRGVIEASAKLVVMADKARDLLRETYAVPAEKIEVIAHGIPEVAFCEPGAAKAALGFSGKSVILTFGLLSPNKGIEVMIDAMPAILERRPDAVYVVLGATHPNLVRRDGEAYRASLLARARDRGVEARVMFLDRFVDQPALLGFVSMADVYVTPYLNEAQVTSGTLAVSFGLGKAVVSTPYWHARDLLADGRGVLVPFGDSTAIGKEVADLLTDDTRRDAMRRRAYAASRSMTWARAADRYLAALDGACAGQGLRGFEPSASAPRLGTEPPPPLQFGHLTAMCDDTGLFQHAVHNVPDRAHGYCVDDNARGLLLACALNDSGDTPLPEVLTQRFTAFLQHAWNPEARRFRNFMSFDRRWLEDVGSEDSHGRALWALGACSNDAANLSRRRWAAGLFSAALTSVETFSSPRAWAFTLLGLDAYRASHPADSAAKQIRALLAGRLATILAATETPDWVWFEEGLAYDNARLPHALILSGRSTGSARQVDAGLRTLSWLVGKQTAPSGCFRPVGSQSFGDLRKPPRAFDQQPLEPAATVSACLAAWRADGDPRWKVEAARAFAWFLGDNDLASPLVDVDTGSCRDGLHPDRANENRGGESAVSYLLALAEMRQLARVDQDNDPRPAPLAISA